MKKTILRNYAKLIAKMGVNVQKGQDVVIFADLDQPEFVKMVVEECYKAGARKVVLRWNYETLDKLHYRYQNNKTVSTLDEWEIAQYKYLGEQLPCRIILLSEDPDGLNGVNIKKMALRKQKTYPIIKQYRDMMENNHQWCIAAVPGEKWAKKLFPKLSKHQAVEKLWEAILATSRALEGDPMENWKAHNEDVRSRCEKLNALHIDSLHYTAGNGTDFTAWMIPEGIFAGGDETTKQGNVFNPNIPSEECFTTPMKGRAEGIVYSSKPLCYQSQLIDEFWIRFHEGKAVEWDAKVGKELLTKIITMDEGSCYLGECALVPYSSPINKSGILFYNTLFDENAVCHLALGMGFPDCIEGFLNRTLEECHELGVNDSMMHEDFMIGTADLSIEATTRDGKKVQIFKNGEWAF